MRNKIQWLKNLYILKKKNKCIYLFLGTYKKKYFTFMQEPFITVFLKLTWQFWILPQYHHIMLNETNKNVNVSSTNANKGLVLILLILQFRFDYAIHIREFNLCPYPPSAPSRTICRVLRSKWMQMEFSFASLYSTHWYTDHDSIYFFYLEKELEVWVPFYFPFTKAWPLI